MPTSSTRWSRLKEREAGVVEELSGVEGEVLAVAEAEAGEEGGGGSFTSSSFSLRRLHHVELVGIRRQPGEHIKTNL